MVHMIEEHKKTVELWLNFYGFLMIRISELFLFPAPCILDPCYQP